MRAGTSGRRKAPGGPAGAFLPVGCFTLLAGSNEEPGPRHPGSKGRRIDPVMIPSGPAGRSKGAGGPGKHPEPSRYSGASIRKPRPPA